MIDAAKLEEKRLASAYNTAPAASCTLLDEGENYKIRRFELQSGKKLICRKHSQHSKRWVIAKGAGKITVNQRDMIAHPGDSISVPVGVSHSITNQCWEKLIFIEFQKGDNLGEENDTFL